MSCRFAQLPVHWLAAALLTTLLGQTGRAASAEAVSQPVLKAAFLYNFAKFTEWPADKLPPNADLVLCVAGDPQIEKALQDATRGRDLDGHRLVVSAIDAGSQAEACHLLYVESADAKRVRQVLERLKGMPVLIVGDCEAFAELGGGARLFVEDGRMRFAVNVDATQRARLRLSSRLLSLAKIVKDRPDVPTR